MAKPTSDQLTLDQAYQAAFLWFDHKGEPPIEITEPAHGSVQLITETTFARVRWATHRAGQASVLAVLKSATDHKSVAMFSASGFTTGAIAIAESQGVALYSFDSFGTAHPMTTHARSLQPDTQPDPPFAPEVETDEEDDIWATSIPSARLHDEGVEAVDENLDPQAVDPDDWTDCPSCGTTHFKNAKYCRECGTHLKSGVRHARDAEKSDHGLRCRTCGGNDIERES
jgi:hypothetical protein